MHTLVTVICREELMNMYSKSNEKTHPGDTVGEVKETIVASRKCEVRNDEMEWSLTSPMQTFRDLSSRYYLEIEISAPCRGL
jgi:hypothetical protein